MSLGSILGKLVGLFALFQVAIMSYASYNHGIRKEPVVILMNGNGPKICAYGAIALYFVLVVLGFIVGARLLLFALGLGWLVLYLGFEQYLWYPEDRVWLMAVGVIVALVAAVATTAERAAEAHGRNLKVVGFRRHQQAA